LGNTPVDLKLLVSILPDTWDGRGI